MDSVWHQPGTALFAVAFLAFFIGFAGGRRRGKREGFAEGLAYAPLEMRRQTWEGGRCVVCGSSEPSSTMSGEKEVSDCPQGDLMPLDP